MESRSKQKEWFGLASDIILAAIPAVLPVPTVVRWSIWLACFIGFVFIILFLLDDVARIRGWGKIAITILSTLVFCCFSWPMAHAQWIEEKASAPEGTLVARDEMQSVPIGQYVIQVGTIGARFLHNIDQRAPFILHGDELAFEPDEQGKMSISTVIRDRNGNVIVKIQKNRWWISNQKNESWDHNYTAERLEVLDGRERVVLQVKLFTNGFQIQGLWHDDNGGGVSLTQLGAHGPDSFVGNFSPGGEPPDKPVPAFRYPSKEHWGEQIY